MDKGTRRADSDDQFLLTNPVSPNRGVLRLVEDGAVLVKPRGHVHQTMGYRRNSQQFLFPEEALYLVDRGEYDLADGSDSSVSFEAAWNRLLTNLAQVHAYHVYAHLRRAGLVVRRSTEDKHGTDAFFCAWSSASEYRQMVAPTFCVAIDDAAGLSLLPTKLAQRVCDLTPTRFVIAIVDHGDVTFHLLKELEHTVT